MQGLPNAGWRCEGSRRSREGSGLGGTGGLGMQGVHKGGQGVRGTAWTPPAVLGIYVGDEVEQPRIGHLSATSTATLAVAIIPRP